MRFATTASVAVIALSVAGLAQVTAAAQDTMAANNAVMSNASGPGNASMPVPAAPTAGNMMDNSAAPPPDEPK